MLNNITYYSIFGKPLIMHLGLLTLGFIIATMVAGVKKIPIRTHTRLATVTLVLASINGLLGVLAYF